MLFLLAMKRVLAQPLVVLHQFQELGGIALVLGGRVIVLTVFGADNPNDFTVFSFLRHGSKSLPAISSPWEPDSLTIMTGRSPSLQRPGWNMGFAGVAEYAWRCQSNPRCS